VDETVYDAAWRAYKAAPRAVANGPSRSAVRAAADAAIAAHQRAEQAAGLTSAHGWVVADGQGTRWRKWGDFGPEWTGDRDEALHFARRVDAEAFSKDDEDAWLIQPAGPLAQVLGPGVKAIAAERERQLGPEGFTRDGDRQYRRGELAGAATAYAQVAAMDLYCGTRGYIAGLPPPSIWPWAPEWWKPVDTRRDLVRAGALIAAQIDLIDSQEGMTDAP